MYLKVHGTKEGKMVAACDKELIGRVLDDGKIHLDLDTCRSFYVGKLSTKEELRKALEDFVSANLVGKNTVLVALEGGFAQESDVIYINTTPHIQIYKI
jgi:hypothetical protein